jgi:hypothetical protein
MIIGKNAYLEYVWESYYVFVVELRKLIEICRIFLGKTESLLDDQTVLMPRVVLFEPLGDQVGDDGSQVCLLLDLLPHLFAKELLNELDVFPGSVSCEIGHHFIGIYSLGQVNCFFRLALFTFIVLHFHSFDII